MTHGGRAWNRPTTVTLRFAGMALVAILASAGCVPPELLTVRSGLDSLRAVVDSMNVRDAQTLAMVRDVRREVSEQRDILLSTRATAGSTTREMYEQMERLEAKLDEVMGRFNRIVDRPQTAAPSGAEAAQLYDQASQDLTQGRYRMAIQGFRDFVSRFPEEELADNAQYGVGECMFALSRFDSAAVEYAQVEARYPQGDKVPAALYKLALSQEKLGEERKARETLEDMVRRFPLSGEAHLARERLGAPGRR